MTKELLFDSAPDSFVRCIKNDCALAEHCLRHVATGLTPAAKRTFTILNPASLTPDGNCAEYVSSEPITMAYGWDKLYDTLNHRVAVAIKRELIAHFGKSVYYRSGRGERHLSPQEQEHVATVFRNHGVAETPQFEHYVEALAW